MICDVCGTDLSDGKGSTAVAAYVGIFGDHPEHSRVVRAFGKNEFNVCYCCFLQALGVKPLTARAARIPQDVADVAHATIAGIPIKEVMVDAIIGTEFRDEYAGISALSTLEIWALFAMYAARKSL